MHVNSYLTACMSIHISLHACQYAPVPVEDTEQLPMGAAQCRACYKQCQDTCVAQAHVWLKHKSPLHVGAWSRTRVHSLPCDAYGILTLHTASPLMQKLSQAVPYQADLRCPEVLGLLLCRYVFTDGDLGVSLTQMRMFLDEYLDIPFRVLRFLVTEINYGGRVTDDKDRRLTKQLGHGLCGTAGSGPWL